MPLKGGKKAKVAKQETPAGMRSEKKGVKKLKAKKSKEVLNGDFWKKASYSR